jgi:hypothetical protein
MASSAPVRDSQEEDGIAGKAPRGIGDTPDVLQQQDYDVETVERVYRYGALRYRTRLASMPRILTLQIPVGSSIAESFQVCQATSLLCKAIALTLLFSCSFLGPLFHVLRHPIEHWYRADDEQECRTRPHDCSGLDRKGHIARPGPVLCFLRHL